MSGLRKPSAQVVLITGDRDSGKTTRLWREIDLLKKSAGSRLAGVATLPIEPGMPKIDYTLQNLMTGERRLLMTERVQAGWERFGRFYVDSTAFSWANSEIISQLSQATHVVFDEIGKIELSGNGFAPSFSAALRYESVTVIAVVRTRFLNDIADAFGLDLSRCRIISV